MEFNPNPTAEEVIRELERTPEGKTQLELAAMRVIVAKQQEHIASLDSGSDETEE